MKTFRVIRDPIRRRRAALLVLLGLASGFGVTTVVRGGTVRPDLALPTDSRSSGPKIPSSPVTLPPHSCVWLVRARLLVVPVVRQHDPAAARAFVPRPKDAEPDARCLDEQRKRQGNRPSVPPFRLF